MVIALLWPLPLQASIAWVLALVLLFLIVIARISARRGRFFSVELVERRGSPGTKELVVMVPGFRTGIERMQATVDATREVCPGADIVLFDYNRWLFSNGDPFRIAERINDDLDTLQQQRQYERIVLVGYSMGALLIRKAYVYGCGVMSDAPSVASLADASAEPRDWVRRVARFVLLAGMNRGWNPDHRPEFQPMTVSMAMRVALVLAKLTHTALLVRATMRGAPFVANLRLQWLQAMRQAETKRLVPPRVVQLLGDRDDMVSAEDSRDVVVARDFIWVVVHNTTHDDLVTMGGSGTALERKRKYQQAFGNDEVLNELRRTNPVLPLAEDKAVNTVVFVLHGIRDMGEWTSEFETPLQVAYARANPGGGKLYIHRASYGFFSMLQFLLLSDRQRNVRWFMDQVTELTARFPNLEEIHFIGHSNGTYVLASALENYKSLRIGRAVLAGSVVRRDYPWSELAGRIKQVRNYVAAGDLIVGLLPKLFEIWPFKLLNPDLGSAGFNGFEDGMTQAFETRFVRGGHGAALVKANVPSVVDFVIHGNKVENEDICISKRNIPGYWALLSNACWVLWIPAVVMLGLLAWYAPWAGEHLAVWAWGADAGTKVFLAKWGALGAYLSFLYLLLRTI